MVQGLREESFMPGGENENKSWNYGKGKSSAIMAHDMTFPDSKCSATCLGSQLDSFYGEDALMHSK